MIITKLLLLVLLKQGQMAHNVTHLDTEQLDCLALNVYHEARGESLIGQAGVAHVTLNRVKDERYSSTICKVVKKRENKKPMNDRFRCQFSWFCDGKSDRTPEKDAYKVGYAVSALAILGMVPDVTNGATHYYNYTLSTPRWGQLYTHTATLGQHRYVRREIGSKL